MSTMQISGAGQLWLRAMNARPSNNCAALAYTTRFASITRKANFSVGGTTKCVRSKRIAVCALTLYWQGKVWRKNASRPASIARCAPEKTHPITRRYGQNFRHDSVIGSEVEGP